MHYAVIQDGIIINVLVFDDDEIAKKFGCLPLCPDQGIGDRYISLEDHKKITFSAEISNVVNNI